MADLPGIYRAKASSFNDSMLRAFVPQVFGDTPIVIHHTHILGSTPKANEMGWVAFNGGSQDCPVWIGAGGTTTTSSGNGTGGITQAQADVRYVNVTGDTMEGILSFTDIARAGSPARAFAYFEDQWLYIGGSSNGGQDLEIFTGIDLTAPNVTLYSQTPSNWIHASFFDGTDLTLRQYNGSSTQTIINFSRTGITSSLDITVPNESYGSQWNGSTEVPTKNAVYDQIEALANVYVNVTGDTMTSLLWINSTLAGPTLRLSNSATDPYLSLASTDGATRYGYLQGGTTQTLLRADVGDLHLKSAAGTAILAGNTEVKLYVEDAVGNAVRGWAGFRNPIVLPTGFALSDPEGYLVGKGFQIDIGTEAGAEFHIDSFGITKFYVTNDGTAWHSGNLTVDGLMRMGVTSSGVITINDDTAVYIQFTTSSQTGILALVTNTVYMGGLIFFRCGDASAGAAVIGSAGPGTLTVGVGTLAGTTGTDGHITVRSYNTTPARLYIENRSGANRTFAYSFLANIFGSSLPGSPVAV